MIRCWIIWVRWRGEKKTVGRPEVQAFAGSLEGVRGRKGVFLTTSTFSSETREYVSRIEKKVVLSWSTGSDWPP